MVRLPSFQDVAVVSPAVRRDPGVQAPVQAFQSSAVATAELSKGLLDIQRALEHNDDLKAISAFNKLQDRRLDLTMGEQNGFVHQKGEAVTDGKLYAQYMEDFDKIVSDLSGNLSNNRQKALFEAKVVGARLQYKNDLLRHVTEQGNINAQHTTTAGLNLEVKSTSAAWRNPAAIQAALDHSGELLEKQAKREAWSKEVRNVKQLEQKSRIHTTVIENALANEDFGYAEAWYKKNKDDIVDLHGALISKMQTAKRNFDDRLAHQIERGIKQTMQTVLRGYPVNDENLNALERAAQGTEYEQNVSTLRKQVDYVRQFTVASPAEMESELNRLDAVMHKTGAVVTPELIDMRDKLGALYANTVKILKENPMGYSVSRGLAYFTPIDLSNPDNLLPQVRARSEVAYGLQRRVGAPLKILFPEEVQQLQTILRKATVDRKVSLLDVLGKNINDTNIYNATLAQIAPDSPVTALAGVHAGAGRVPVAHMMLRGEAILRPIRSEDGSPDRGKLWPMPPEKDLRDSFERYERNAFAGHPQARSDHYQAALAIYAAKSADVGDATGEIDTDRWDESIRIATGGIEKWNGRYTIMPYGMERSDFKDGLYRRIDQISQSGRLAEGVNVSKLRDLPLEPIRAGQYIFRAGDGVLVDKNGTPIIVDFNVALPTPTPSSKRARRITEAEMTALDRYP